LLDGARAEREKISGGKRGEESDNFYLFEEASLSIQTKRRRIFLRTGRREEIDSWIKKKGKKNFFLGCPCYISISRTKGSLQSSRERETPARGGSLSTRKKPGNHHEGAGGSLPWSSGPESFI